MTGIYDLLNEAMHEQFGGSVTRLSDACGVSVALGSRWLHEDEAKRIVPSPASCEKIAAGLHLDPDYVLEAAGHRHPRVQQQGLQPRLAAFLAHVEAAFHAMSDQEWAMREPLGRQLFSVPTTDGKPHGIASVEGRRKNVSASSSQDDQESHNTQTDRYPRVRMTLASNFA